MSQINPNLAAGVAQTALNAQQVSRERDKRAGDLREHFDRQLRRFEEKQRAADDPNDPDAELPDRQAPGYEQLYRRNGRTAQPPKPAPGEPMSEGTHRLDVTA